MLIRDTKQRAVLLAMCLTLYFCEMCYAEGPVRAYQPASSQRSSSSRSVITTVRPVPTVRPTPAYTGAPYVRPYPATPPRPIPQRTLAQPNTYRPVPQAVPRPGAVATPSSTFRRYQPSVQSRQQTTYGSFPVQRAQLLSASRTNSSWGANYERRATYLKVGTADWRNLRQASVEQYLRVVGNLEQARSQVSRVEPRTYISLAEAHLDAARELVFLGRQQEARQHIRQARYLLNIVVAEPFDPNCSWRSRYLLGDVNLFESDIPDALSNYQIASDLNPNFVPASAMVQYLSEGQKPNAAPTSFPPASPLNVSSTVSVPSVSTTSINAPSSTVSPMQTLVQDSRQIGSNAATLSQKLDSVVSGKTLAQIGDLLWMAAAITEIPMLDFLAAGFSLLSTLVPDTPKP
jgi:tetratricopeptide (TPR) repeat protein